MSVLIPLVCMSLSLASCVLVMVKQRLLYCYVIVYVTLLYMLRYCICYVIVLLRYCICYVIVYVTLLYCYVIVYVTLLYTLRYCVTPSIADIHSSNYHCHFLNWMSVRVVSYLNVVHLLTYSTFLWSIFVTRLKNSAKKQDNKKRKWNYNMCGDKRDREYYLSKTLYIAC